MSRGTQANRVSVGEERKAGRRRQAAPAAAYQVERVPGGEGGVDVAEGSGEAQHLQLRRPQCHEDGHRVVCSVEIVLVRLVDCDPNATTTGTRRSTVDLQPRRGLQSKDGYLPIPGSVSMITFFFVVPSTAAMDATQISIPPGYPSGTTQSNPTNATAYRDDSDERVATWKPGTGTGCPHESG